MPVAVTLGGDPVYTFAATAPLPDVLFLLHTATTELYTLSLHDALPICSRGNSRAASSGRETSPHPRGAGEGTRSEEHTSELQSRFDLVCRFLLEKKKIFRRNQHDGIAQPHGARATGSRHRRRRPGNSAHSESKTAYRSPRRLELAQAGNSSLACAPKIRA